LKEGFRAALGSGKRENTGKREKKKKQGRLLLFAVIDALEIVKSFSNRRRWRNFIMRGNSRVVRFHYRVRGA